MDLRVPANTAEYEASLSRLNQNLKAIFELQYHNLKAIEVPRYTSLAGVDFDFIATAVIITFIHRCNICDLP
jgi:hypothetical protein